MRGVLSLERVLMFFLKNRLFQYILKQSVYFIRCKLSAAAVINLQFVTMIIIILCIYISLF